jgi:ferredoxin
MITVEPLERQVECRPDQAILDACLRAGVWLPHACTHGTCGTCGTCKVQVLDGDIEHNDASDFALMEFERTEGKTLICVATPSSDVTIEADVEVEEGVTYHTVRDYVGKLVKIEDIARDTRRLVIDLDKEMAFNPGQYVTVEVPGTGAAVLVAVPAVLRPRCKTRRAGRPPGARGPRHRAPRGQPAARRWLTTITAPRSGQPSMLAASRPTTWRPVRDHRSCLCTDPGPV